MNDTAAIHQHPVSETDAAIQAMQHRLQCHLDKLVTADETLTGASLYVIAPSLKLDWGMAAGVTEREGDTPITIQHPLRIASVTKSFVAAAILRLYEQGRLDLEIGIGRYLPKNCIDILEAGGYNTEQITPRQLLMHTTGLVDFFYTETFTALLPELMSGRYKHLFTLEEQLRMAMTSDSTSMQRDQYYYSDTNYILLGAILEQVTQSNMATATRELVGYDKLGLENTW